MTNTQLYLALAIPVFFNAFAFGLLWLHIDTRFNDLRDTWRSELRRVEEVLDSRVKHLEDTLKEGR